MDKEEETKKEWTHAPLIVYNLDKPKTYLFIDGIEYPLGLPYWLAKIIYSYRYKKFYGQKPKHKRKRSK